ncbi:hypothetical protein ACFWYW_57585 [Nonomuraea sp. NPDC059023]|uniref:hypothetical protein n=1 Tax=unclassified Nonomuraea TaxID=2593643 RepID=UPI00368B00C9
MGSRGFVTFVVDGIEKTTYNHCDSYPGGLGVDVLTWLRLATAGSGDAEAISSLRESVRALRVVDDKSAPTEEDVKRLAEFADLRVSDRDPRDWYVLLRETQGDPGRMLQAGAILDASDFPADSLFAEWGYVIDLDAGAFEAYEGFQKVPHTRGRFASRNDSGDYYPVALAASWPLGDLPSNDAFSSALEGDEE